MSSDKQTIYDQCINDIRHNLLHNFRADTMCTDICIDPCAGNGDFIDGIKSLPIISLFFDANKPIHPSIQQHDFLSVDFNKFDKTILAGLWYDKIHIIGCPPDNTAEQLIQKMCEFAYSISFIIPQGLDHAFSPQYKLLFSKEIPTMPNQNDKKVFQIWRSE